MIGKNGIVLLAYTYTETIETCPHAEMVSNGRFRKMYTAILLILYDANIIIGPSLQFLPVLTIAQATQCYIIIFYII